MGGDAENTKHVFTEDVPSSHLDRNWSKSGKFSSDFPSLRKSVGSCPLALPTFKKFEAVEILDQIILKTWLGFKDNERKGEQ